ncbi:mitochondrial carrier domain-containing protein [Chytriomyces cf. hyalinus JEL632]|nr:mitochondrial carrier domain-containing protein [Chytriomyces cf. hyalinus JEL632]
MASTQELSVLADLAFGSIAGVASKLIEHPADTVKTVMQTQTIKSPRSSSQSIGTIECCKMIMRQEGPRGFFKGLSAQLFGAMLETSAVFLMYNNAQTAVRLVSNKPANVSLSTAELTACGFLSGTGISFLLTPIELVKCKLQVQAVPIVSKRVSVVSSAPASTIFGFRSPAISVSAIKLHLAATASLPASSSLPASQIPSNAFSTAASTAPVSTKQRHFSGSLDVIRHTIKTEGLRGLFRGHSATFWRESIGTGVWFGAYEHACAQMRARGNRASNDELNSSELVGAGAISGIVASWVCFPADAVKTRMQTADTGSAKLGFASAAEGIWKKQGVTGFYTGSAITIARSGVSSAVIFLTYESLKKLL